MLTLELRKRLTTGAIAVLVLIALVAAAATSCIGIELALLCVTALSCISCAEAVRLRSEPPQYMWTEFAILAWSILTMLVVSWLSDCTYSQFPRVVSAYLILQSVGVVALFYYIHWRARSSIEAATRVLSELPIAYWMVSVGGSSMLALLCAAQGATALGWMAAVVAANDIAAYFVGRSVGGAKFSPQLSPNKTVSGSIGGYGGGIVAAVAASALLPAHFGLLQTLVLAMLVITAAQMGDLAKSYLKRMHGKKDTGALLPGHGGILDRMDGHFAAAPLVLAWMAHYSS